jgi:hypothetical protein
MFRDVKRQADAAGFLQCRSTTLVTRRLQASGRIVAATALELYHCGKIARLN